MGYGTESENQLPTTFFKIKGLKKGSDEIYFAGTTKKGSEYVDIDSKPTKLFGHLTKVSTGSFEWEDEIHKTVKLVLDSDKDRVVLEGGFSNLMINIINTLAGNEDDIDKIDLGVYISKSGYASVSISINGGDWKDNNWKWDYKKKLKPLVEETKNNKGKVVSTDKSKLIDFLVKEIESDKFQKKIVGNPPTMVKQEPLKDSASIDIDADPEDVDGLPF